MVSLCGRGFESHQLHLHRIDRGLAVMWQVPCRCFLESLMDGALHLVAMLQEEPFQVAVDIDRTEVGSTVVLSAHLTKQFPTRFAFGQGFTIALGGVLS